MIRRLIILLFIVGCAEEIETYYSCIKHSDITSPYFSNYYVDSLNESAVIKEGIKGMMKRLDPYTKLLEGNKKEVNTELTY